MRPADPLVAARAKESQPSVAMFTGIIPADCAPSMREWCFSASFPISATADDARRRRDAKLITRVRGVISAAIRSTLPAALVGSGSKVLTIAPALPVEPRERAAGVRMGIEDHLVGRRQLQPGGHDAVALGAVAREAHVRPRFRAKISDATMTSRLRKEIVLPVSTRSCSCRLATVSMSSTRRGAGPKLPWC